MSTPEEKSKPTEPKEKTAKPEAGGRQSQPDNTVPQDGVTPDNTVPQDET